MRLFGNGKEHKSVLLHSQEMAVRVSKLETELAALRRDVVDLDQSVRRWMQRDNMRARREAQTDVDPQAPEQPGEQPPPSPPRRTLWGPRARRLARSRRPAPASTTEEEEESDGVHP